MTHQYINFHVGGFSSQWPMCSPLSSSGCPFPVAVLLGDSICCLVNIESERMGGLLTRRWRDLAPCPYAIGRRLSVTAGMSPGLDMSWLVTAQWTLTASCPLGFCWCWSRWLSYHPFFLDSVLFFLLVSWGEKRNTLGSQELGRFIWKRCRGWGNVTN